MERTGCGGWSTEPIMLLYMFSSYMKMPAFMTLLFEKACYQHYGWNSTDLCTNVTAIKSDTYLQDEANRLFTISSLSLLIPSIFAALFIGALSDIWSIKYSMLIPFGGLILSNINYIIQSHFVTWHAYWLMPSDIIFGVSGGFSAVIGVLFAYSTKISSHNRSTRIAIIEGAIGVGGFFGSICSGFVRRQLGFIGIFVVIQIILFVTLIYILLVIKDFEPPQNVDRSKSLMQLVRERIREIFEMYSNSSRNRHAQFFLNLVLFMLFAEFVCFAGMTDILFPYVRYRFGWTDVEYGWFSGISMGVPSLAVIVLYPLLSKKFGLSNGSLTILGLATKTINIIILAAVSAGWLAMASLVFAVFTRFISTGLRAMASFYVSNEEQGKLFALVGLLQSFAFLIASPIFNGGYRETLHFYPGMMFIVIAVALIVITILMCYIIRSPQEKMLHDEAQTQILQQSVYAEVIPPPDYFSAIS